MPYRGRSQRSQTIVAVAPSAATTVLTPGKPRAVNSLASILLPLNATAPGSNSHVTRGTVAYAAPRYALTASGAANASAAAPRITVPIVTGKTTPNRRSDTLVPDRDV